VILVNDQAPSVAQNPNAQYFPSVVSRGSGNTLETERAWIPKSVPDARRSARWHPERDNLAALQA